MDITGACKQVALETNNNEPIIKEINESVSNRPSKHQSRIKKPVDKDNASGRKRANSNIVPNFEKRPQIKKEIKPVQTIGNDRFSLLLSMYDRKAPENKENNNTRQIGKLDTSKFSKYIGDKDEEANPNDKGDKKVGVKDGIKNRMENLLKNNENKENSAGYYDPVLENRKKKRNDNNEEEDEDDVEEFNEEDLHIGDDSDLEVHDEKKEDDLD
jgi:hypothetical protein